MRRLLEDPRHFGYYSAYGQMHDVIELTALRQHLELYAGIPLVSYQRRGYGSREVDQVTVAPEAARAFEATQREGRELLASISPPELPVLRRDAQRLSVPDGITGLDMADWLVEQGYARETSDEVIDYLCQLDRATALAEGLRMRWEYCRFDHNRPGQSHTAASRTITLLGPVHIGAAFGRCCRAARVIAIRSSQAPPDPAAQAQAGPQSFEEGMNRMGT